MPHQVKTLMPSCFYSAMQCYTQGKQIRTLQQLKSFWLLKRRRNYANLISAVFCRHLFNVLYILGNSLPNKNASVLCQKFLLINIVEFWLVFNGRRPTKTRYVYYSENMFQDYLSRTPPECHTFWYRS